MTSVVHFRVFSKDPFTLAHVLGALGRKQVVGEEGMGREHGWRKSMMLELQNQCCIVVVQLQLHIGC